MEEIVLDGKKIVFDNPNQIINMGGPWVGNLSYNNSMLIENVVLENYINDEILKRFYFICYNKVSKWESDNFFQINSIDYKKDVLSEIDIRFEKFFIDKITDSELCYYESFHRETFDKLKRLKL